MVHALSMSRLDALPNEEGRERAQNGSAGGNNLNEGVNTAQEEILNDLLQAGLVAVHARRSIN